MSAGKDNFILRNINKIFVIGVALGLAFSIVFLIIDSAKSLEPQKQDLFKKEESIVQDISNITKLSDTDISVSKNNIDITIIEDDCKLVLVYDKSWNLERKELIDTRISSSFFSRVGFIIFITIGFAGVVCMLSFLVSLFLPDHSKYKENKLK